MHDLYAASQAAPAPSASQPRVLEIRFTGSGSEYFRIWIVNLLLTLLTLGLYWPFAKARRIRYFYANTVVDGQALGFHGDPWKMFRGFVLMVVLMGTYSVAGRFSPAAAFVAFLVLCAVWPALWRASLQFRLGNTSWRGLRMRFEGSLKGAYLACAPSYLPSIALIGGALLMAGSTVDEVPHSSAAATLYGLGALCLFVMGPWSLALFKRYQHNGYRIAGQHGRANLPVGRFYLLSLKVVGVALLPAFLAGVVIAVVVGAASLAGKGSVLSMLVLAVGVSMGYLLFFALVMPYAAARLQDIVWNGTRSEALTFQSRLRARSLCGLTIKNWLLTLFTLGLYRPFAAVATARLRLQAVRIDSADDPATWVSAAAMGHADATGDIAGDFFGIDMGL